jgi:hypothetical protein
MAGLIHIFAFAPRYNIGPAQRVPVIVNTGDGVKAVEMRWGIPSEWSKTLHINAQAERIQQTTTFKPLLGQPRSEQRPQRASRPHPPRTGREGIVLNSADGQDYPLQTAVGIPIIPGHLLNQRRHRLLCASSTTAFSNLVRFVLSTSNKFNFANVPSRLPSHARTFWSFRATSNGIPYSSRATMPGSRK